MSYPRNTSMLRPAAAGSVGCFFHAQDINPTIPPMILMSVRSKQAAGGDSIGILAFLLKARGRRCFELRPARARIFKSTQIL